MDEYIDIFHSAGYKTEEDVENLKELNNKELKKIGVHKRGNSCSPAILQVDTNNNVKVYTHNRK